jgi:hypothetical protein
MLSQCSYNPCVTLVISCWKKVSPVFKIFSINHARQLYSLISSDPNAAPTTAQATGT